MILKWLRKKPYILTIENKKYKTLKILKILKNKEELFKILSNLQEYPFVYNNNWLISHNFEDIELDINGLIKIHNLHPLNEIVNEDEIDLLLNEENFVIKESEYIYLNKFLSEKKYTKNYDEYYQSYKEHKLQGIIPDDFLEDEYDSNDEELEKEISKMVDSDEILDSFISKCDITGHALFLFIPEKNDIDLFEFHNFEDLYKCFSIVHEQEDPKNYRYSISEELLTVEEYVKFLNIFGPFKNIENCTTIKDLNEWIIEGKKLFELDKNFQLLTKNV